MNESLPITMSFFAAVTFRLVLEAMSKHFADLQRDQIMQYMYYVHPLKNGNHVRHDLPFVGMEAYVVVNTGTNQLLTCTKRKPTIAEDLTCDSYIISFENREHGVSFIEKLAGQFQHVKIVGTPNRPYVRLPLRAEIDIEGIVVSEVPCHSFYSLPYTRNVGIAILSTQNAFIKEIAGFKYWLIPVRVVDPKTSVSNFKLYSPSR